LSRHVRFCKSVDGVRLAYASDGRGPAMVEVATWLNHLEHDWTSPVWGPRLRELSKQFALTRYDARGCGLSDRTVEHFSFEASLADLEAVVDAAWNGSRCSAAVRAADLRSPMPRAIPIA
jgi:pimeloyl-ACP methyl ester carboxylesterase